MGYKKHSREKLKNINKIRKALKMIEKETPNNIISDKKEYILWCDVETTGLDERQKEVLEIAAIITDMDGNILGKPFNNLVNHSNLMSVIDNADSIAKDMHMKNGLFEELWLCAGDKVEIVDENIISWISRTVEEDSVLYFGGRSITLDRNFTRENFPAFYSRISHMSVDLTTLILSMSRNNIIDVEKIWINTSNHRALDDIQSDIKVYQKVIKELKTSQQ